MNTIENNKLITEFMELPFITEDGETNYIKDLIHVPDYELSYHEDWNWLMEVVEKIKEVSKGNMFSNENMKRVELFKNINIFSKKEEIYNSCVEFITWYNLQNS